MLVAHPKAELFGLDMSPGMAGRARGLFGSRVALATGDMEHIPFTEACFDAVVTCWTLYFMRDIDTALVDIKRSLRPGGRFVVAVSAPDHMREYYELASEAERVILGSGRRGPGLGARFDLESGPPYMRRHFARVDLREWHGEMVLPDVGPLVRIWDAWRPRGLAGKDGDLVRAEFVRLAEAWLARDGEIHIGHHGAALVGYVES